MDNLVIEHLKDRGIPSGAYADITLEFALEYGGGTNGSEIKFMHDVACHFGCSNVLGDTFWTAVAKTAVCRQNKDVSIVESCTLSLQSVCSENLGWHWQDVGES